MLRWLGAHDDVAMSVITVEELMFGIARAPTGKRGKLTAWCEALLRTGITIHTVTATIARASGELRAARERNGRRVAQADALIAATAVVHGLTLATRNVDDFADFGALIFDPFAP